MRSRLLLLGEDIRDQGAYSGQDGSEIVAVWNATGRLASGFLTTAQIQNAGITPGAVAASRAIVVDADKMLDWAVSDDATDLSTPINFALTLTGVGASVDGAKFAAATEVALGTYANALNAKLDFGAAGRVTGLGGALCAELDLGPGTTSGSYAVFEAELNVPASGSLGTRTSFMSLNAWGANVAAFDTGGFLFDLNGLTSASGKLFFLDNAAGTVAGSLRIQINGTPYYLLLYSNQVQHT